MQASGRQLGHRVPTIQVFIPVFNDIHYFPRALSSVLSQEGVELQVIVSDNASTDGTYEYACQAAVSDPRIIVHRNPRNIGMIGNLNKFAVYVTCDYYMLLCSDDMLGSPTALRRAQTILEADSETVSVYCDLIYIDGDDRKVLSRRFRPTGLFDADATLRDSICSSRNLFGIPLLSRRSASQDLRYPEHMNYVADVYFSALQGKRGRLFHLAEPLILNRYTSHNMTRRMFGESARQFNDLVNEFRVSLVGWERLLRAWRLAVVIPAKHLFFLFVRWRSGQSAEAPRGESQLVASVRK